MNKVSQNLALFSRRLLPRILTQVCRDPDSPAYGSFDRNWWHYKIRDFSSIILQQGGYALYAASELSEFTDHRSALQKLAAGSCRFWNERAKKFRAFEEYYPWEEGYPPVAFSSLAVSKLVAAGIVPLVDVLPGITKAAKQLQSRFEPKATNQQVAGAAALCWIRKVAPELVDEVVFQDVCSRTLACQHAEGWYMEYGGPDLGYLSVVMDCLWDAFDATDDERFRESARRALHFVGRFTTLPYCGAGMHNARNTDYIVPYGTARFLEDANDAGLASTVLTAVFEQADKPEHFLAAIDDRYYCHYIGHSLFRALPLMQHMTKVFEHNLVAAEGSYCMEGCGYYLHKGQGGKSDALVSCKKGGIATFWFGAHAVSDFGWVVRAGEYLWVSHWWADFWKTEKCDNGILIKGVLSPHKENESTPLKHMVLRGMSLVLGRRLIGLLKEKMIFKEKQSVKYAFTRKVEWQKDAVRIEDVIQIPKDEILVHAPRSSKRHVASADSYHREDLMLAEPGIAVEESRTQQADVLTVVTTYRVKI